MCTEERLARKENYLAFPLESLYGMSINLLLADRDIAYVLSLAYLGGGRAR